MLCLVTCQPTEQRPLTREGAAAVGTPSLLPDSKTKKRPVRVCRPAPDCEATSTKTEEVKTEPRAPCPGIDVIALYMGSQEG